MNNTATTKLRYYVHDTQDIWMYNQKKNSEQQKRNLFISKRNVLTTSLYSINSTFKRLNFEERYNLIAVFNASYHGKTYSSEKAEKERIASHDLDYN
jgi:hypothetical protein